MLSRSFLTCKAAKKRPRLDIEVLEGRDLPSGLGNAFAYGHLKDSGSVQPAVQATAAPLPIADLSVAITNSSGGISQGGNSVVWNVTVTNQGPAAATLQLTTSSTGAKDLIWWGAINGSDVGMGVGDINTTVTLQGGKTAVYTIWGHIGVARGVVLNTATVSAAGTTDPNPANNSATTGIIVV